MKGTNEGQEQWKMPAWVLPWKKRQLYEMLFLHRVLFNILIHVTPRKIAVTETTRKNHWHVMGGLEDTIKGACVCLDFFSSWAVVRLSMRAGDKVLHSFQSDLSGFIMCDKQNSFPCNTSLVEQQEVVNPEKDWELSLFVVFHKI